SLLRIFNTLSNILNRLLLFTYLIVLFYLLVLENSETSSYLEFLEFIKEPVQKQIDSKFLLEKRIQKFKTLLAKLEASERDMV
ncbi:hypothetical protein O181_072626, partial [Austropuccinia psidii MF-1]|nr:hypothetical protein [Austropuccinia psidii MF-1]